MTTHIRVRGAAEHNLKGIDVELPRNCLTVVTGLSGSGKSSLAYDIIYREGQRRFVESLSAYARQYMGKLDKPRVDHIEGLSPTISIDQKTISRNPRSTVGTITEILDHLRLLFARVGTPHCPKCDAVVTSRTVDQIVDAAYVEWPDADVLVCAPIVLERKGEYRKELEELRQQGFVRVRIDGEVMRLDQDIQLARYERHSIEVVYDRVQLTLERRPRFTESVEKALQLSDGLVDLVVDGTTHLQSSRFACAACDISLPELEPRLFSFNSPQGACPECDGLGRAPQVDLDALIPDPSKSLREGAVTTTTSKGDIRYAQVTLRKIGLYLKEHDADLDTPWKKLPKRARDHLLYGGKAKKRKKKSKGMAEYRGIVPLMQEAFRFGADSKLGAFMETGPCTVCDGTRLRPEARAVRFRGYSLSEITGWTVEGCREVFEGLKLEGTERLIADPVVREVLHRLQFLDRVGLRYLNLDRSADTLSGGEAQRIRLASQLGSGLKGVLYVLDEPSIGLHPRDNRALLETLRNLRDLGNTVLVVEHDQETIEAADHILDVGPGAGVLGGELVASGGVTAVRKAPKSITGRFLSGKECIETPSERRPIGKAQLCIRGARQHNLKNVDVAFPLGLLVAVTGVSGSGKSTLIDSILYRSVVRALGHESAKPGLHDRIDGLEHIDKVIRIDQKPIGRTPRSNPGTYTKVFDEIRELFARTPMARVRGYKKGRFSFNVKGGRCESCGGAGVNTIRMQFLADVEVTCEECSGHRYNPETLEVTYRGKNIYEVLEMPLSDACEFFSEIPKIQQILQTLVDVGLGYVRLGQTSTTLSGGEAQRVKLAFELRKSATGKTLYLLDEPTTGLHFDDIRRLLQCLTALVERGNTVIVIEHNLDVVKVADHVIELGPEGGAGGGKVIAEGTPEAVASTKTPTGIALADTLAGVQAPSSRRGKKRASASSEPDDRFVITGARENNLKNLQVEIPRGKMTVITGPSGSGKSTLAFDILFAEGQRRYVESLSTYARRFLGRMQRAQVDRVEGIAPAIAIDQKNRGTSPRSTVATTTEIYDYLRLLFARVGIAHCPECQTTLESSSPTATARAIEEQLEGQRTYLTTSLPADVLLDTKAQRAEYAEVLAQEGFARLLIDGEELRLEDLEGTKLPANASRELVIDRIIPGKVSRSRLVESIEVAYERGEGQLGVRTREGNSKLSFSQFPSCPQGHFSMPGQLTPRVFSFNHHSGACPRCHGLGYDRDVNPELLFTDPSLPLFEGAMDHRLGNWIAREKGRVRKVIDVMLEEADIDTTRPVSKLGKRALRMLFDGTGDREYSVRFRRFAGGRRAGWASSSTWEGLKTLVRRWYERADSPRWRQILEDFMSVTPCSECGGGRLRRDLLEVRVGGRNIHEVCQDSIQESADFFQSLELPQREQQIAAEVLHEVGERLDFLLDVGLDYLTLDRVAETLSGGEAQRIRLATQIGNRLVGVLYVLDEPTIGLHQRDNERLLQSLLRLRDQGNSVVVVEHDPQTIELADHVVDLGPGAGSHGGSIVAAGTPAQIQSNPDSVTGAYLSGNAGLAVPATRREGTGKSVTVRGAATNNLRDIDVSFPLGTLTVVTGVSGSGKSSLVMDILGNELSRVFHGKRVIPGRHRKIDGLSLLDGAGVIDQSPLGRSPSSNAATYTGLFGPLRSLFAKLPLARARGYTPGRFSFNVAGGRCEHCEGKGALLVEMHFLSDVWIRCEVCGGRRYNRETLAVRFKGHTIADVLELDISAALELFSSHPQVSRTLQVLEDVGLGYLSLGQPATTLSGGEAQRVKLASELARRSSGRMLYVLDEPTTGLHFSDVEKLVLVLQRLVERGDTVVIIEHNLDVIKCADHVIDLGPEGGSGGGTVIAAGTPEAVAESKQSHTGRYLGELLSESSVRC